MVQLFYYESVGAKCKKLIGYEGGAPIRVTLHQEEGLGCSALSCHWLVEFPCFFTSRLCRVTEFSGGRRRRRGWATVSHSSDGCMAVLGRFRKSFEQPIAQQQQQQSGRDFFLCLTSQVTEADFQQGYSMTGWLEAGCRKRRQWQVTHAAVVRRLGY